MAASQIPQSSPRTSTQSLWHGDAAVTALCAPPASHCDAFNVCQVSLLLEKHSNLSLLWLRHIFWWSSDRCCFFSLSSLRYRPRVSNLTYTGNDKGNLLSINRPLSCCSLPFLFQNIDRHRRWFMIPRGWILATMVISWPSLDTFVLTFVSFLGKVSQQLVDVFTYGHFRVPLRMNCRSFGDPFMSHLAPSSVQNQSKILFLRPNTCKTNDFPISSSARHNNTTTQHAYDTIRQRLLWPGTINCSVH